MIIFTPTNPTKFSLSFFAFRAAGSTSPTNIIDFLDGAIDISYSIVSDTLALSVCSGTFTLSSFTLPTDQWFSMGVYIDGANSKFTFQSTIAGLSTVSTCVTSLALIFLPKS